MTKVGNVIKFYVLATSLKDVVMIGWVGEYGRYINFNIKGMH